MAEKKGNDSTGKTLLSVLILCLVCSIVVAGAAVGLKPRQQEQRMLDKQRNILEVVGLLHQDMSADQVMETFTARITPKLVDLDSGKIVDGNPEAFNQAQALRDPKQSIALKSGQDPAGIQRRSNLVEIYLVRDEKRDIQEIILPIYGNGLWSMMHAFVAVETDGHTIRGVAWYDHGETPGLGDAIENPGWRRQFVGKQLFDAQGLPALRVVKGGAQPGDIHGVDGLSGASLTAKGVQHSFDFWMGELGFGPFLKNVREGGLNHG